MQASTDDEIAADFAALHKAVSRVIGHSYETLTTRDRFTYLERLDPEKPPADDADP